MYEFLRDSNVNTMCAFIYIRGRRMKGVKSRSMFYSMGTGSQLSAIILIVHWIHVNSFD